VEPLFSPEARSWPDRVGQPPERMHEARKPQAPGLSVLENVDRALFGAWSEGHPGNKTPKHR
jgi:hypothetical protein